MPVQNVLLIRGKSISAEIYLSFFADCLKKSSIEHLVFLSPLSPSFSEGIYLPENQTLLIKEEYFKGDERARHIVAERFFKCPVTEEKETKDAEKAIKEMICKNLALAGRAHAALETVYSRAMDFKALTKYKEILLQKIYHSLAITPHIREKKQRLCH